MPFNSPEFEITHLCNKQCDMCSHRIKTSSFTYIEPESLDYVLSCFSKEYIKNVKKVLIIGGEPLLHPYYTKVLLKIKNKFPKAKCVVSTNGSYLDKVPENIFNKFVWRISEYPKFNDKIIKKYRGKPHVSISGWGGWWDINNDPNLTPDVAKTVEKRCFHQVRIIGTKLYRCCLSEGIEREYNLSSVHVQMSANWEQWWKKLPVWKACQHCFKANVILGKWSKSDNKNAEHD